MTAPFATMNWKVTIGKNYDNLTASLEWWLVKANYRKMTLFPLGELFSFIQTIVKRSLKECFAAWIAPQRSQSLGTLGERIERPQNGAISTSWCGNVTRKIEKANAENHNTSNEKRLRVNWTVRHRKSSLFSLVHHLFLWVMFHSYATNNQRVLVFQWDKSGSPRIMMMIRIKPNTGKLSHNELERSTMFNDV